MGIYQLYVRTWNFIYSRYVNIAKRDAPEDSPQTCANCHLARFYRILEGSCKSCYVYKNAKGDLYPERTVISVPSLNADKHSLVAKHSLNHTSSTNLDGYCFP